MAQRAPGVVRHGSARDLADSTIGYSASGASEHTRESAHGKGGGRDADQLPESIKGKYAPDRKDELIFRNRQAIRKIVRKMKNETDPAKLEKLQKNYAIKSMFLSKLERGRQEHTNETSATGPARPWEKPSETISEDDWDGKTVIDIPGEDEFEPF